MILEKFLAYMLNDTITMEGLYCDNTGFSIDEDFVDSYKILGAFIEMLAMGDIHVEIISNKSGREELFRELLSNYIYTT